MLPQDDDAVWFHQAFNDPDNQFAVGLECPEGKHLAGMSIKLFLHMYIDLYTSPDK
jgi:hypothetical protein